jgi:hypothetical protein
MSVPCSPSTAETPLRIGPERTSSPSPSPSLMTPAPSSMGCFGRILPSARLAATLVSPPSRLSYREAAGRRANLAAHGQAGARLRMPLCVLRRQRRGRCDTELHFLEASFCRRPYLPSPPAVAPAGVGTPAAARHATPGAAATSSSAATASKASAGSSASC